MSTSHETPTYYDSVGLLALCDAIAAVEGVPYRPVAPPQAPAAVYASGRLYVPLPGPYPPVSAVASRPGYAQHPLLSHVPPSATTSSSGTMSYAQSQRSSYAQFPGGQRAVDSIPATLQAQRPGQTHGTVLGRSEGQYNYVSQAGHSMQPSAVPRPAGPGSSASVSPVPGHGVSSYRQEECPHCGRLFKGPKASTHKQQHIRRLHPNEYTPKRGGKKRIPI